MTGQRDQDFRVEWLLLQQLLQFEIRLGAVGLGHGSDLLQRHLYGGRVAQGRDVLLEFGSRIAAQFLGPCEVFQSLFREASRRDEMLAALQLRLGDDLRTPRLGTAEQFANHRQHVLVRDLEPGADLQQHAHRFKRNRAGRVFVSDGHDDLRVGLLLHRLEGFLEDIGRGGASIVRVAGQARHIRAEHSPEVHLLWPTRQRSTNDLPVEATFKVDRPL